MSETHRHSAKHYPFDLIPKHWELKFLGGIAGFFNQLNFLSQGLCPYIGCKVVNSLTNLIILRNLHLNFIGHFQSLLLS